MEENEQIDGRSLRAEKLYKATHDLLIESATVSYTHLTLPTT